MLVGLASLKQPTGLFKTCGVAPSASEGSQAKPDAPCDTRRRRARSDNSEAVGSSRSRSRLKTPIHRHICKVPRFGAFLLFAAVSLKAV